MAKAPPKLSDRMAATRSSSDDGGRPVSTGVAGLHRAEEFERELEKMMNSGDAVDVRIAEIKDSPYQVFPIKESKVRELKANIKAAGRLINPILLRRLKDGTLELVAGHHRKQACKELGMETIRAVIVEMDDDFARFAVFYDNLHGPKWTDYEKFLGFRNRLQDKKFSQKELAIESGLSERQIGRIMAFAGLPEQCHAMLKENTDLVGANAADDLREQIAEGREALVIEAFKLIAGNKLDQTKAAEWVVQQAAPQKKTAAAPASKWQERQVFAGGKKLVCTVRRTSSKVLVDFSKPEFANQYSDQLMEKIEATVREFLGQNVS